jgi:hypothetical protein
VLPFDYSNNFDNYGKQPNLCPPANPKGICAAVAAINSFIFLQNQYPSIYDNKLAPNAGGAKPNQTDVQDAEDFGVNGWQVGGNPPRQGYYPRPGDAYGDYLATKQDWIEDRVPGMTTYEARYAGRGGVPDIAWLAEQIRKGQDVEFFVLGEGFFHALTLVGVYCKEADYKKCGIKYQDPNDPNTLQMQDLGMGGGGLSLDGVPGSSFKGAVTITGAFAESPVPEPATVVFVAAGLLVVLWRRRLCLLFS